MTEKQKKAIRAKTENAEKWGNYSGPFTPDVIAEMHADNRRLQELGKEATEEWLQNREHAFMSGRSQAVRSPKEYRLPDEEMFVNRIGNTITLTPVSKIKESFAGSLQMFTDDFMEDGRLPQIDAKRDEL